MFNNKKNSKFDTFTDASLGDSLSRLSWEWDKGSLEICFKPSQFLHEIMRGLHSFEFDGFTYFIDRNGYLMRSSPKIKVPPEDLTERVAYWIDGIPVTIKAYGDKLKKLGAMQ